MTNDLSVTDTIDARGYLCPLPVLKIIRKMRELGPGEVLLVMTDDPAAVIDVPHYCNEHSHELVVQHAYSDRHEFHIRKVNA